MQVLNVSNHLLIKKRGNFEGHNYQTISDIEVKALPSGDYQVMISFAGDRDCNREKLFIDLAHVDNQPTWTNDQIGANNAVLDILGWSNTATQGLATESTLTTVKTLLQSIDGGIPSSLGQKTESSSMPVVIASNQSNANVTPNFTRVSDNGVIADITLSFSVYNSGLVNGTLLGETLKPKEKLSFDAGIFNQYLGNVVTYDATGTEFIITYNSL